MTRAAAVALLAVAWGCSSEPRAAAPADGATDGGGDAFAGYPVSDAAGAAHLDAGDLDARPRADRVARHAGVVLASMHLRAIYVTRDDGTGGAPSADASLAAIVAGDGYWSYLAQYGVGPASFDGATRVTTSDLVAPSAVTAGRVAAADVAAGLRALLRRDAGILHADGYAVLLPDGLDVVLPGAQGATCSEVASYHADDGDEPFAVFGGCAAGRSAAALSHELAEMATDPWSGSGWFDDAAGVGAGEVGDLCNGATARVSGLDLAEVWSNADGRCAP